MTTDHSNAIRCLRNAAHDAYYIAADKDAADYRAAADALEDMTAVRTVLLDCSPRLKPGGFLLPCWIPPTF